jgi:hypothetical protein
MTEPEHTPMDPEAEAAMLEALRRDVNALPARISRARQIARGAEDAAKAAQLAHHGALAAHRVAMDEVTARQVAEHEARKKELAVQSAELAERERSLETESRRGCCSRRARPRSCCRSRRDFGRPLQGPKCTWIRERRNRRPR